MKKLFVLACALLCGVRVLTAMDLEKDEKKSLLKKPNTQRTIINIDTDQETKNDRQKTTIKDPAANALFERIQQEITQCKTTPKNKQKTCKELQKILTIKNLATRNQVIRSLEIFLGENIKRFSDIKISSDERTKYTKKIKKIISRNTWINGLQPLWFILGMTGAMLAFVKPESFTLSMVGMVIVEVALLIGGLVTHTLARSNSLELANHNKQESKLLCWGTYLTEENVFSKTDENQRTIKYNEQLIKFWTILQNIKLTPLINAKIQEAKKQNQKTLQNVTIPETKKLIKKDQKEMYDLLLQLNALTKKQR